MASFIRRVVGSIASKVRTYVQWLYTRDYSRKSITASVRERFGGRYVAQVPGEIKMVQAQQRAAEKFNTMKPSESTKKVTAPTQAVQASVERYHVKFTFDNPNKGAKDKRGYTIDLPLGLTKRQAQKRIRDIVINDILASSNSLQDIDEELKDLVGPIRVTRIERL